MKPLFKAKVRPIQVLPLGFLVVILVGSLLLTLPQCSVAGKSTPWLDALFTATSATCVTGLVVVDTGTHFTLFGQIVIVCLIQIGGLGFMSIATLLFLALGKQISLSERMTLAESLSADRLQGVLRLLFSAVRVTLATELCGALLLSIRFVPMFGWARGLWYSLFHSVSAFCNAGFDLMGDYASLTSFVGDPLVCFTIMLLIILGGLGFGVVASMARHRRFPSLPLHAKLALCATVFMLLFGFISFTITEWSNPLTLGALTPAERFMAGLFQSVTTRTAGFNTIDQMSMRDISKFASILFMSVGAAPAGTGGGIKVTTVALIMLQVRSVIKNHRDVELFGRRIPTGIIRRAQTVLTLYLFMILLFTAALAITQLGSPANMGIINQAFEVASAFGTVGLSVGVTAALGPLGRTLLIIGMFLGRVGPLTMVLALSSRPPTNNGIQYPEGNVLVG